MGIDASIALGYQPIKIEPQSNALMRLMQMEGAQRQNELGGLQLQQTRDDIGRKNALTEYLRGNPNLDDAQAQSRGYSIDPAGFDAVQRSRLGNAKTQGEIAKTAAEAEAKKFEIAHKKAQIGRDLMSSAVDQQSYDAARAQGEALGLTFTGPAEFDAQYIASEARMAQTQVQRIETAAKQRGFDLTQRGQDMTAATAQQGQRVQMRGQDMTAGTAQRGQNMTDLRARETASIQRDGNAIQRDLVREQKQLQVDELQAKKDDRGRSRSAAISGAAAQISVIDKALTHPGRETSTGLSGTLDPRNYVAGTDAADFRSVLDQLGGSAFLQAFESLKGGGQITEVEGKKATDAIARLQRSQSDKEFKASLKELRGVMTTGYERLSGAPYQGGGQPEAKLDGLSAAEAAELDALRKQLGRK